VALSLARRLAAETLCTATLLPVGVLATWKVSRAVKLPIIGIGGVSAASDVVQYILTGASLVGVGRAALRDPRLPERLVRDLDRWCADHRVSYLSMSGAYCPTSGAAYPWTTLPGRLAGSHIGQSPDFGLAATAKHSMAPPRSLIVMDASFSASVDCAFRSLI
jgi:hypothetical protein